MSIDSEFYFSSIRAVLGPVEVRSNLNDYVNVTDSGIIAELIEDNGLLVEPGTVDSIRDLFVESLGKHIETVGPFPVIRGAAQILERLGQSAEYGVAIATGGWRRSALLKLESSGFRLDGIPIVSCDDSPSRTEIMRIALSKLGDEFESVVYFGDAEWDKRACHALGWDFVAVGPDLDGIDSYDGIDL